MIIAHGIIALLVFFILFPLGTVIIKFLGNMVPQAFAKHQFIQLFALILVFLVGGLGVYIRRGKHMSTFRNHHLNLNTHISRWMFWYGNPSHDCHSGNIWMVSS